MRSYNGPAKQWVEITAVDPTNRRVDGRLGDGGNISISVHDVPPTFRWPVEGEHWSVERDKINPNFWVLCSRVHGRSTIVEDGKRHIKFYEDAPIEQMQPGEARIDAEVITNILGQRMLTEGDINTVFVQSTQPTADPPYLWIQTDSPTGGWTLWFEDGS